ncbi:Pyruvate formate-lyase [Salmonella enterica subsp. enterica serovar Give str. S5-487]|nr:Pyruvate formate-lyase [Salmonella enterica subsp. enterica serovar Give str. S5-487]
MTQLKLDTLSDRIKAHKTALVHIVKPPVCTERAQHYTEMYQQHLDKPIPVRRALALVIVKRQVIPRAGAGPSPGGTHYLDKTR